MEVRFTADEEVQLAQLAAKAGTDTESLVKDAALRLLEDEVDGSKPLFELPVWDLGVLGSLRRCDIYDDV